MPEDRELSAESARRKRDTRSPALRIIDGDADTDAQEHHAQRLVVAGSGHSGRFPVSAPLPAGSCHLLVADDALTDGHLTGTYVAACGALVSSTPPSSCALDCECDRPYCPECVREARRWNAEAGQATDCGWRARGAPTRSPSQQDPPI